MVYSVHDLKLSFTICVHTVEASTRQGSMVHTCVSRRLIATVVYTALLGSDTWVSIPFQLLLIEDR